MKVVVIYESMFGNTRVIANAIAAGLRPGNDVAVVPVARADKEVLAGADLVLVGGPTHIHGLSRAATRRQAVQMARKPQADLTIDEDAEGQGLHEWFSSVGQVGVPAAAFDTRLAGLAALTGRASRGINAQLRRHGFRVIASPESFLVDGHNHLVPGEELRARAWGEKLARKLQVAADSSAGTMLPR